MRYNVTFSTTIEVDFDDHPPGKEVAHWLQAQLRSHGADFDAMDLHGDFAWSLDASGEAKAPWLLVGHVCDPHVQWLLQIKSNVGWIGRLLGRSDTSQRDELVRTVHEALSSDSRFSDVLWHQGDFAEGDPTRDPTSWSQA